MKRIHKYWVAGVLEGEGSFGIYRRKSRAKGGGPEVIRPMIQCTMSDRDVLERLKDIVGYGVVYKINPRPTRPEHYKILYRYTLYGTNAAALMQFLYPLMGKRRRERIRESLLTCGYGVRTDARSKELLT